MQPHDEWFAIAERDLLSATKLFEFGLYDTAIFHTQQCAEKMLKGFLTFHSKPIEKIHNLVVIINRCIQIDSSFLSLMPAILFLNNRDTQFRYPSEILEPTHEEITQAIAFAEKIFFFVKSLTQ